MAHYIQKDALVEEIEKTYNFHKKRGGKHDASICDVLYGLLHRINTLEVKEVDLEKEVTHYLLYEHRSPLNEIMHQADLNAEIQYHKDIENAFKAGFELGKAVNNKALKGE